MWHKPMTTTLNRRRIVAIEDTPAILTFLRVSLEALGAQFHEALTASGGLALCEDMNPEVVVLDLGLPDKEGLNILPLLKRSDKNGKPPVVVVLTVRSEAKFKERAMELGADAYITKPFRMEHLIEVIHEKLGLDPPGTHLSLVKPRKLSS